MERYRKAVESLVERARNHADQLAESDSDKSQARSDILEEFADAIESALDELVSDWEKES